MSSSEARVESEDPRHVRGHEDFLVSLKKGNRTKRVLWKSSEPLPLDFPIRHLLEAGPNGLRVRHLRTNERFTDLRWNSDEQAHFRVRSDTEAVEIFVRKIHRNQAAFYPTNDVGVNTLGGLTEYYIAKGVGSSLVLYSPMQGKYIARENGKKCFSLKRDQKQISIEAYISGLSVETPGKDPVQVHARTGPLTFNSQLDELTVRADQSWWKINRVSHTMIPNVNRASSGVIEEDLLLFKRVFKRVAIGFTLSLALLWAVSKPPLNRILNIQEPKRTIVQIKPFRAKSKPVVEARRIEKPAEKVAEKSAEKTAEKPAPKKADKLTPKVAKQDPKPKPIPKKTQPKIAVQPRPVQPPPSRPMLSKRPPRAVVQAKQKAKIDQSLSFLSNMSATASKTASRSLSQNTDSSAKYKNMVDSSSELGRHDPNALSKMGPNTTASGPINTVSSRSIEGGSIAGGKGKGLNDVQGKVSLSALQKAGSGGSLDGFGLQGGLSVNGPGAVSESDILNALKKHSQQFQYCYEKALLSAPGIAGTLVVQWNIQTNGMATDARVIRSELNNSGLHQCITSEMSKIQFPKPKGGAATAKYPFAFTPTSI